MNLNIPNIAAQAEAKKQQFEAHVMGLIGALGAGITLVKRPHIKGNVLEMHVSPEAYDEVFKRVNERMVQERTFDDVTEEQKNINSMRVVKINPPHN